jgi:hypothetical protein
MKKIYEFIDNIDKKRKILELLDTFIFFDGEFWMFADGDREFISYYIDDIIPTNDFIQLGIDLSNNLNNMKVNISEYNSNDIEKYLNNKI